MLYKKPKLLTLAMIVMLVSIHLEAQAVYYNPNNPYITNKPVNAYVNNSYNHNKSQQYNNIVNSQYNNQYNNNLYNANAGGASTYQVQGQIPYAQYDQRQIPTSITINYNQQIPQNHYQQAQTQQAQTSSNYNPRGDNRYSANNNVQQNGYQSSVNTNRTAIRPRQYNEYIEKTYRAKQQAAIVNNNNNNQYNNTNNFHTNTHASAGYSSYVRPVNSVGMRSSNQYGGNSSQNVSYQVADPSFMAYNDNRDNNRAIVTRPVDIQTANTVPYMDVPIPAYQEQRVNVNNQHYAASANHYADIRESLNALPDNKHNGNNTYSVDDQQLAHSYTQQNKQPASQKTFQENIVHNMVNMVGNRHQDQHDQDYPVANYQADNGSEAIVQIEDELIETDYSMNTESQVNNQHPEKIEIENKVRIVNLSGNKQAEKVKFNKDYDMVSIGKTPQIRTSKVGKKIASNENKADQVDWSKASYDEILEQYEKQYSQYY